MKKLIVMQGIPGSGKSTMASKIFQDFLEAGGGKVDAMIFSTDDYWYDENKVYRYDPAAAVQAHRWNQRRVVQAMQDDVDLIIIDNTNIQKWQAAIYFTLADIYGYEKSVVSVQVPVEIAIARNAERPHDRRVPEDVLRKMHSELEPLI